MCVENRLAMHQPNFLPWIGYFHKMASVGCFVLLDCVQVPQGRSYATRTKIKTPDGERWLSIPKLHSGKKIYKEQQLPPDMRWGNRILETIKHNYARAPFWDYNDFSDWYVEALYNSISLADFNTKLIQWARMALELKTVLVQQSAAGVSVDKEYLGASFCRAYGYDVYFSGNGARDYNDDDVLQQEGVRLEYQEFTCPIYPQLWGEFIPNLSIIDLIFNNGPGSKDYLN